MKKGFSLIEVMVAIAIMAVAFVAILNFQGQALFMVGRGHRMTQATFLARQKMAELLLQIEKEYKTQRVFPEEKSESGNFDRPHDKYKWEWKIRKVAIPLPAPQEGAPEGAMFKMVSDQIKNSVREIKLIISWEEGEKERSIDVVTHITKI